MRGNFSNASHYNTIIEKCAVTSDTWITFYNTIRFYMLTIKILYMSIHTHTHTNTCIQFIKINVLYNSLYNS